MKRPGERQTAGMEFEPKKEICFGELIPFPDSLNGINE